MIVKSQKASYAIEILLLLFFYVCHSPLAAQQEVTPPDSTTSPTLQLSDGQIFRVGYLRRETTGHPDVVYLEGLRSQLMSQEQFVELLDGEGFAQIGLFPCDGSEDMIRRLNVGEFDLAFSPASIFLSQQNDYLPFLQSRRQGDVIPVRGRIYRQGIIFVSARSELFNVDELTSARVKDYLDKNRLALVSTQSVAGFQAPLLELYNRFEVKGTASGYSWFETSEEVVKGVLSGLADIGACDESAMRRVLEQVPHDKSDELIRILLRTDPVITDPVIIKEKFDPRRSSLGRMLRSQIRQYSLDGELGDIQYSEVSAQDYRSLGQLLLEYERKIGEVPR